MKKKGVINTDKHILLDETKLSELDKLLAKHSDKIHYTIRDRNHAVISYTSLQDFLKDETSDKERMESLTIHCFDATTKDCLITIHSPCSAGRSTILFEYEFTNIDEESIFRADITRLLESMVEYNKTYLTISYIAMVLLFTIAPVIMANELYKQGLSRGVVAKQLVPFFAIAVITYLLFSKLLDCLFPKVIFMFGEEKKKYENLKRIRKYIFEVVIGGVVIGLIINYISHGIWG